MDETDKYKMNVYWGAVINGLYLPIAVYNIKGSKYISDASMDRLTPWKRVNTTESCSIVVPQCLLSNAYCV